MSSDQLQTLEYTLMAAAREALKAAHQAPVTKAIVAPSRASRALETAADAVRDWRRQVQDNSNLEHSSR